MDAVVLGQLHHQAADDVVQARTQTAAGGHGPQFSRSRAEAVFVEDHPVVVVHMVFVDLPITDVVGQRGVETRFAGAGDQQLLREGVGTMLESPTRPPG